MSDDHKPDEEPLIPSPRDSAHEPDPAPKPGEPTKAAAIPAAAQPTSPAAPAPSVPVTPPAVPIDYAMRAPSKPFTIPAYTGCLFKMVLGFAVLIVMGYCALIALNPKAQKWATQGAKDGTGGPTPFKAMNQVLAIPAQAIGKTKDVVAASDARVGVLDRVIVDSEGKNRTSARSAVIDPFAATPAASGSGKAGKAPAPEAADNQGISKAALIAMNENQTEAPGSQADGTEGQAPKPRPAPREAAPVKPLAQVKLAGGIVIANASPAGSPPAPHAFMYWVVNLSISGVHQGSPSRFLMNNRLVYEGQELNAALGITFDHLEFDKKLIVFRDKSGAVVTRSY